MNIIFMVIAVIATVGILVATPPAPPGCEDDHVPFRQVVLAIFAVGAGGPGAIDSGDYVALSLIGVALPVLVLRNAELLVSRKEGSVPPAMCAGSPLC